VSGQIVLWQPNTLLPVKNTGYVWQPTQLSRRVPVKKKVAIVCAINAPFYVKAIDQNVMYGFINCPALFQPCKTTM
jgi:hypothetical protein